MNDTLKKRLVGAGVLVALAVIFLPMVVDDSPQIGITESNIPPQPDELKKMEARRLPTDEDLMLEPPAAGPVVEEVPPVASPAPKPAPKITPPPAKTVKTPVPQRQPTPKTRSIAKASSPSAWILQVASFGERRRADALVKRLKAKKYRAFVVPAEIKGKTVYRVRVGPELDRRRTERLASRLQKQFKLRATVLRYH